MVVNELGISSTKYVSSIFHLSLVVALLGGAISSTVEAQEAEHDVAFEWIEAQLKGIRTDFARPPIHARPLPCLSGHVRCVGGLRRPPSPCFSVTRWVATAEFDGIPRMILPPFLDIPLARKEAAAYRVLTHRYANSPGVIDGAGPIRLPCSRLWDTIRPWPPPTMSTDRPAALGNYIAEQVIAYGLQDGANEAFDYTNTYYEPFNDQLVVVRSGQPDRD